MHRLGVLAFGDSVTNAGGELQWGVALHSWALWVARALGLPYTGYAFDGALADDVLDKQIPRFTRYTAHPDARYDLGCLYIGVNDIRSLTWDPDEFEQRHRQALEFLAARCDRTLTLTPPLDLGWPRAREKVNQATEAIRRSAATTETLVADLGDFKARNHVMADHVHPTAFGQIAIALRALETLAADDLPPRVLPSWMILYEKTWYGQLRGDLTYVYRRAKVTVREAVLSLRLRL
ncbi:MAG TPA: GDSL-type esterase/lipase family protein [Solirubrobacteraceae bacterium]|nr:GDSL-type esterase/lipase family protein [Solirubrobacteraceae bacterium]